MKHALPVIALFTLTFAVLLTTGVINETFIFLFLGFSGLSPEIVAENLHQVLDAWSKSDWRRLGKIGAPYLHSFLWLYLIRSAIYLSAIVATIFWLKPYAAKVLTSFRQIENTLEQGLETRNQEERKAIIVRALRARSAQKRGEAYASLGTALLCLLVAIGFVTREIGAERPQSLDYSVTSIDDAMSRSETVLRDAGLDLSRRA